MDRFYAFGGFGSILVIVGVSQVFANLRFLARSTAAKGKFVKWDIDEPGKVGSPDSKDGRRSYRPVVAFQASDGTEHRAVGAMYSQAYHAPAASDTYPVRYETTNPGNARIVTFTSFWMFPLGVLAGGVVCLVIAAST